MNFSGPQLETDDSDAQTTAMVDVVFVLLSFFVLAGQFRVLERDLALGYTSTELAAGAVAKDFPEFIPIQLVNRDGEVAILVGQATLKAGRFEQITAKLTQINLPDREVRILADPTLKIGTVAAALDAVLASPMKKVSVSRLTRPT